MSRISSFIERSVEEPPFRLLTQKLVKFWSHSIRTHAKWDTSPRPNYLLGVLKAADQAISDGIPKILAVEFGVAAGNGLLALQDIADAVERETGVEIGVVGFDTGGGMPHVPFDYRDHTDWWIPQDYPMDVAGLKGRLMPRTELILGPVANTVRDFVAQPHPPVGFVSFDLDYYSSTKNAMKLISGPSRKMLRRTPLYFDDIDFFFNHNFAGELLAIDEFNTSNTDVKISKWHGVRKQRPFPEASWLEKMYVAHDIDAIGRYRPARPPRQDA